MRPSPFQSRNQPDAAMAPLVESLKFFPTPNGKISFAPEGPLLATGSIPGSGCITLRVLRSAPGLHKRLLIDDPVTEFAKPPAAFCGLCWSKPLGSGGSSCPAGLIAGGHESGEVAVWNPRKVLGDMTCFHPDEKSFVDNLREGTWVYHDIDLDYDFCELDKGHKSPTSPPLLEETTGNLVAAESVSLDLQAPVARFSKHLGSVRGLGFSSYWPNLLGSGAENGRIMVWDLSNPSAETMPTWQTESDNGDAISCISWSPLLPRVLGSTSFQGVCIWDTRSCKSPVNSVGLFPRKLSCLAFSPVEQNSVVVAREDYLDAPSLAVWDLRRMDNPVSELCENEKGVIAMSWSPHREDALLVSTKSDNLILFSLPNQEVIWKRSSSSGRCYDVDWSASSRGVFAAASHNNLELFKLNDRALPPLA